MRFFYFCLVFLLTREIETEYSPHPGAGNFELATWPSSYFGSQSPSGSTPNPCVLTKIQSEAPDTDTACHNGCLASKIAIRDIHKAFANYETVKYLYRKCGMVTHGKCSTGNPNGVHMAKQTHKQEETYSIGSPFPICWCSTQDQRKNTLSNCRYGIQVVRKFTEAVASTSASTNKRSNLLEKTSEGWHESVHMQQGPPPGSAIAVPKRPRSDRPRRPNTGFMASCCGLGTRTDSPDLAPVSSSSGSSSGRRRSPTPPRRSGKSPEVSSSGVNNPGGGGCLYTPVRVSRNVVQAMLDTGAEFCLIHQQYAGDTVPTQNQISGGGGDGFNVLGTTTINVEMNGVRISVTGYVVESGYEIVLGTDFFVAYKTKIRIINRKMEIDSGLQKVLTNIQFIDQQTGIVGMLSGQPARYSALQITVLLNGYSTRMVIDTGSEITITSLKYARSQPIIPTGATCTYAGADDNVGFLGETTVNVGIENVYVVIPTLVPQFIPDDDFLVGTDFIAKYIELIDYESRLVTFRLPGPSGYRSVTTTAYVIQGQ